MPELPEPVAFRDDPAAAQVEICDWHGLKLRNVVGWGDVSAAGLPSAEGLVVMQKHGAVSEGDVIWSINGERVRSLADLRQMADQIAARPNLKLTVWRFQRQIDIDMQM
jgi:S1-C subfamily serine protease